MTTPATFNSPHRVIKCAMENTGKLEEGQEPNSEQLANYMPRLNDVFNSLQVRPGLKLWLNNDLAVTLVAGQNLYSLGPTGNVVMTKPLRVIEGYYQDSNGIRRPLIPLARNDWDMLSVVSTQGTVTSYFTDKQQLSLNVYTWLTPDAQQATGQVHIIIQQQVTGLVSLTDSMNFPVEWFMTLQWALADQISTGQPQAIITRCKNQYDYWLEVLEDWDVEDASTTFTPDTRALNQSLGRFR